MSGAAPGVAASMPFSTAPERRRRSRSPPTFSGPRGRYVILAFVPIEVPFAPWLLARGEFELTGSLGYGTGVFSRVIDLIAAGAYPTQGWVEHIELGHVSQAFNELRAGSRMKLLVDIPPA